MTFHYRGSYQECYDVNTIPYTYVVLTVIECLSFPLKLIRTLFRTTPLRNAKRCGNVSLHSYVSSNLVN